MWVIFRDPRSLFNHLDKYVVAVVADEDILEYQKRLVAEVNGKPYELHDVGFLQQFVTAPDDVDYFARKYKTWTR